MDGLSWKNPIKMDDWGVALFQETFKSRPQASVLIYSLLYPFMALRHLWSHCLMHWSSPYGFCPKWATTKSSNHHLTDENGQKAAGIPCTRSVATNHPFG